MREAEQGRIRVLPSYSGTETGPVTKPSRALGPPNRVRTPRLIVEEPDSQSSTPGFGAKNTLFDQWIAERARESLRPYSVPAYQPYPSIGTELILHSLNTNFETWSCFGRGRSVSTAKWDSVARKLRTMPMCHPHESDRAGLKAGSVLRGAAVRQGSMELIDARR
jgi:hypothetical protein